eukprot:GHRQ01015851.1.p1 GENE.GHRQ01015851.1~~GHRQ01015851.1.p1  ORF type:complete len:105 (+),score=32.68 GHRQ01015851.1:1606-1920(+)
MHIPACCMLHAAGQGANSALESCKVLSAVLAQAAGDVSQVPQRFSASRLADMHALNELDAKAYSFFRCGRHGGAVILHEACWGPNSVLFCVRWLCSLQGAACVL